MKQLTFSVNCNQDADKSRHGIAASTFQISKTPPKANSFSSKAEKKENPPEFTVMFFFKPVEFAQKACKHLFQPFLSQ